MVSLLLPARGVAFLLVLVLGLGFWLAEAAQRSSGWVSPGVAEPPRAMAMQRAVWVARQAARLGLGAALVLAVWSRVVAARVVEVGHRHRPRRRLW